MEFISDKKAGEVLESIEEAPTWLVGSALALAFTAAAFGSGYVAAQTFPHHSAIIPGLVSAFTGTVAASIPSGAVYEFIKQRFGDSPKPG